MKISYNWLRQYIDTDLSPERVSEILTDTGLEVEGLEEVQSVKGGLEGVVIGEVLSSEPHPNADKLSVCQVDLGKEQVQIVCGAPNVAAGQKVPVATVGATLYPNEEGFSIKKAKIRGEASFGMICAEDELGLGNSHDGIMVLDPDTAPGTLASEYFEVETDHVFEIGLTPNRIDGASHIGAARDLAAFLRLQAEGDTSLPGTSVQHPSVEEFKVDNNKLHIPVEIVEKEACKRYSALTISGVKVGDSPAWLKNRLLAIGLKPINNIVDVTNFVLHEVGQPLHAFDADRIKGGKVLVRTLPEGTKITTLDEEERELRGKDLIICDAEKGLCIAGVFGGVDSGVKDETRNIFLESACFDPVYVRKTARHHVLNTDASFRFERGSDPNITVWAMKRAALLIQDLAGGEISSEIVDVYPEPVEDFKVELSFANLDRLIGNHIPEETVRTILASLDIRIESKNDKGLNLAVPPYRADVQREADVIEEILRVYGFNNVTTGTSLRSTMSQSPKPDREKLVNLVADLLSSNGFYEMKSNSLTAASYYPEDDPGLVRLFNPLSQDLALMRQNLVYGALEAVARNVNRKVSNLRLYEFGNCYFMQEGEKGKLERFREEERLGIFLSGQLSEGNWMDEGKKVSFFHIKSFAELVLGRLGIDSASLEQLPASNTDYNEGLAYRYKGRQLLELGQLAPALAKRFDIKQEVFAAEFNWDLLLELVTGVKIKFESLSRFQPVTRDLSLLLDRQVSYGSLRELAFKSERKLLKEVRLFDVYEGDKIEKGKKSYALSFTLMDKDKTLTDKQIDKAVMRIARAFESELGASVRGL